jgi:hypothetical protein
MTPIVVAIAAVILLIIIVLVGVFNKLVTYRNRYQNAFAQIEVQLKRLSVLNSRPPVRFGEPKAGSR